MPQGTPQRSPEPGPDSSALRGIGALSIGSWFLVALLLCLTAITDQDLGFHIAWGRILAHDFQGARTLLLGQDSSVSVYAYSYWLYQVTVAALFDHGGAWALVLFRTALVLSSFCVALLLARRARASLWASALLLAFGVAIASERFVDRPDLVSHLFLAAALWVLVLHRRDRGVWALVPLEVVWVNTHHHFTLLPALFVAFAAGDALEGRREFRRAGLVLGALLLATCVNPAGPGAWLSQLKLAGVFSGTVSPIPLKELVGPYSPYKPFLALWIFRFGFPLCLALAIAGRKRIGWGALLALLVPAILAVVARRAMSLFAIAAVALLPPALDQMLLSMKSPARRVLRTAALGLVLAAAGAAVIGLLNGRIFLAQDKDLRVGAAGTLRFPGTEAARFLRARKVEGPLFHNPTLAGAILMENGTRLTPFLDPRWCGTPDENAVYLKLVRAGDAQIGEAWRSVQDGHRFETVLLDFYEMPALLRLLSGDPEWALVYLDDAVAVFCRRAGVNAPVIAACESAVRESRGGPDPAREAALGTQVVRYLRSPNPSILHPLAFPWESFRKGNFGLQVGDRAFAQAAYLDLYARESGALHASRHRVDVLNNTLWCLAESPQWEARAALCAALADLPGIENSRRRGLRLAEGQALVQLGRGAEAERVAGAVADDAGASADERWTAWTQVAAARESRQDHLGAVQALQSATQCRPRSAETWRAIGAIFDAELNRSADAIRAYETFRSLGGRDAAVDARLAILKTAGTER